MTDVRPSGTTPISGPARLVGGATLSQSLSAASNFIILVALARAAGTEGVGDFVLAFTAYGAALGLQRAAITDPLLARAPGTTAIEAAEERSATTSALIVGAVAGLVTLVVGLVSPYHQLILVAPFLPGLLLQDVCRYLFFRRNRPGGAALLDGIWVGVSCLGFVALEHHPTSGAAIVLWGIGGTLSAVVGLVVIRVGVGAPMAALRWWRSHLARSGRWLTLEAFVFHADLAFIAFGFTAVAGAAAFGEMQAAQALVGIAAFVTRSTSIVIVTHLSREEGDARRAAMLVGQLNLGFVMAVTLALLATSSLAIDVVYGPDVVVPSGTILASGVSLALFAAAAGPLALLRVRRVEHIMPAARFAAFLLCAPTAVIVARHSFQAALWVVAVEAGVYLAIVSVAAHRLDPHPAPNPRVAVHDVAA